MYPAKPTLAMARRLFKRRNPGVKPSVSWDRKPVATGGGWSSSVLFEAEGYANRRMRLYSDADGVALF